MNIQVPYWLTFYQDKNFNKIVLKSLKTIQPFLPNFVKWAQIPQKITIFCHWNCCLPPSVFKCFFFSIISADCKDTHVSYSNKYGRFKMFKDPIARLRQFQSISFRWNNISLFVRYSSYTLWIQQNPNVFWGVLWGKCFFFSFDLKILTSNKEFLYVFCLHSKLSYPRRRVFLLGINLKINRHSTTE